MSSIALPANLLANDEVINVVLNRLIATPLDPEALARTEYLDSVRSTASANGMAIGLAVVLGGAFVANRMMNKNSKQEEVAVNG